MFLRRSILCVAAACALGSYGQTAFGQLVGRDIPYRFLPRPSVLHETGGFPGFDNIYHIRGTFDFHLEPSPLLVFPPVHTARFENVDAWGVHPRQDRVVDIDMALNLSGLRGGELLRGHERGVFRFQGKTDDGSSVNLQARMDGPWLYLRGATTAPEGGADFIEYSIKAIARRQPHADFNQDGTVDAADLAAWGEGSRPSGADFLNWQQQLGETAPTIESLDQALDAALAAADASVAAVPEPSAFGIAAIAAAMFWSLRRRGPELCRGRA